jgi:WD40 repeat protein
MLASVCRGSGALIIWEASTAKDIFRWKYQGVGVLGISFSPDSQTLASTNYDGSAYIWDLSTVRKALER